MMDKKQIFYYIIALCVFIFVFYVLSSNVKGNMEFSSVIIFKETHTPSKINKKPNFVFFLTDDQDSVLESVSIMKKVKALIADKGATFSNSFVASPLCCPSRSSIFSGQYVHNHKALNNSITGGCSSQLWQKGPERRSFVNSLYQSGYQTFFAGKYLNQYGKEEAGGLEHIPPGWDWWIGLKGNSKYYDYFLSVNGTKEEHGRNPNTDYLTNIIKNRSMEFLQSASFHSKPFFMMLSTPACHAPFEAEPKYYGKFTDKKVPRTENFNIRNDETKHWLLRLGEQPLRPEIIEKLDEIYRKRLRTLLSVDDMVESVVNSLREKGVLDNTYLIFTSDNGYHLGQFSLPLDKREPYEFDIRVPLFISGPGIVNQFIKRPVSNIDLAPTILDLAGISVPKHYDGESLKSLFHSTVFLQREGTSYANSSKNVAYELRMVQPMRKTVLVEHSGEGYSVNKGCEHLGSNLYGCDSQYSCKCSDSKNNTYACLRHESDGNSFLYCQWKDDVHFEEFYDLQTDNNQLNNTVMSLPPKMRKIYSNALNKLIKCHGVHCSKLSKFVF